jgi:hypothetical protein
MGFLADYDALTSSVEQLTLIEKWIVENPSGMLAELRAQRPIFITPGPVIVSRYNDVIEVASLDQIYSVKPYGVAMMRDNGAPISLWAWMTFRSLKTISRFCTWP